MQRAAILVGTAAGLRAAVGDGRRSWLNTDYDAAVAAARAALGEPVFQAAWAKGRDLPYEEAVQQALASFVPVSSGQIEDVASLTPREREVLRLIARGMTNREIGQSLVIAEGTAGLHVKRVLSKLGFRSRVQLAAWCTAHAYPTAPVKTSPSGDANCSRST